VGSFRSLRDPSRDDFGSQLALTVWEKVAVDDRRIEDQPA
jgi:hypothetical protein